MTSGLLVLAGGGTGPAASPQSSQSLPRPVGDRQIFRVAGQPWRYCGVTGFKLIELVRRGEDITPFLRAYRALGANVVRALANKPAVPGLDEGWSTPPLEVLLDYYQILAQEGFYGETTLFGSQVDARFVPAWIEALQGVPHALVELLNEPGHPGQYPANLPLQAHVAGRGALPFASGDYDPPQGWFGTYLTYHSPRDSDPFEAARKAKGVLDLYGGWDAPADGSGTAFHGSRCPVVDDEPGKPQDFGYNHAAIFQHFAVAGLLGAGATYHTLGGQFGQLPSDEEVTCATYAYGGLLAFPADAALGAYRRVDEGPATLRTYYAGRYGVRVHPQDGQVLIGV